MVLPAPPIDERGSAEVAGQIRRLLVNYLHQDYQWGAKDDGGEIGGALTGICAHFSGLVIDRINRAPEKNFLAFLDLLGNSLTPAIPAEAALTFTLDASAPGGRAIPAGTKVQADPPEGGSEPVVFETDRDLWLSNFELKSLNVWAEGDQQARDLQWSAKSARLDPPHPLFGKKETLYFGLDLAAGRSLEVNRSVSLYFFVDAPGYDSTVVQEEGAAAPRVAWEYQSGTGEQSVWLPLSVEDGTENLQRSGAVVLLVPADLSQQPRNLPNLGSYWIRASLRAPSSPASSGKPVDSFRNPSTALYTSAPMLNAVALNTVSARHAMTLRDEVLGSSTGSSGQSFKTFRRPILPGERLEILEARSGGAVAPAQQQDWTLWREVPDFHASAPSDRHYLVDRLAGEVRFGDGRRGMIPPAGTRNVRMASYRTGGGLVGNVAAGAASTLVTAGRYIEKVTNVAPATGGAEGETTASLLDRAPKALRHRHRAVTNEDYADLARLASTEVARALCVPLIDLARDPVKVIETVTDEEAGVGRASVIVVPHSAQAKPLPSQFLLRQVADELKGQASATAAISVVGPIYLKVDFSVALKLVSLSLQDQVVRSFRQSLATWLHPLTGRYGEGWAFGREPHESDIYRLARDIPGIDHVRSLKITATADVPDAGWAKNLPPDQRTQSVRKTQRFLVCSGQHVITAS